MQICCCLFCALCTKQLLKIYFGLSLCCSVYTLIFYLFFLSPSRNVSGDFEDESFGRNRAAGFYAGRREEDEDRRLDDAGRIRRGWEQGMDDLAGGDFQRRGNNCRRDFSEEGRMRGRPRMLSEIFSGQGNI